MGLALQMILRSKLGDNKVMAIFGIRVSLGVTVSLGLVRVFSVRVQLALALQEGSGFLLVTVRLALKVDVRLLREQCTRSARALWRTTQAVSIWIIFILLHNPR